MEVSHLIAITKTRINLTLHVTLVNHRLGLSATHKCDDLQNLTGVDCTVYELDGIEINSQSGNGVSQLHLCSVDGFSIG